MLALSLWLTCAALGEPPAPAAAPAPAEAAAPAPAPAPAAETAAVGEPVLIVATEGKPTEPAKAEPAPAAPPFVLTGFLPADRPSVEAAIGVGTSFDAIDGGVDIHFRYRGFLGGVIVSGTHWNSNSDATDWTRTLGLEAGYGWSPGRLRLEGALGYGRATERRDPPSGAEQSTGHFTRVRVAADWAVAGGEGWRVAVGAGAWWRTVDGLAWSSHQDLGIGLRLSGEMGW